MPAVGRSQSVGMTTNKNKSNIHCECSSHGDTDTGNHGEWKDFLGHLGVQEEMIFYNNNKT